LNKRTIKRKNGDEHENVGGEDRARKITLYTYEFFFFLVSLPTSDSRNVLCAYAELFTSAVESEHANVELRVLLNTARQKGPSRRPGKIQVKCFAKNQWPVQTTSVSTLTVHKS